MADKKSQSTTKKTAPKKSNLSRRELESLLDEQTRRQKKALGTGFAVFLYIASVSWIMVAIPVLRLSPIISAAIMLLIIALATLVIVYTSVAFKRPTATTKRPPEKQSQVVRLVEKLLTLVALIAYLWVSFATGAWHITWIIWVIFALVSEAVKLILALAGFEFEEVNE